MSLIECADCHRPVRVSELACPFCGASSAPLLERLRPKGRIFHALGASATAVVLAACYGSPPIKDSGDSGLFEETEDADGDGFDTSEDCDDSNAAVFPGATEVCDDTLDNDCDGATDADDSDCAAEG